METLGDRIRTARKAAGKTQQEVADHFRINRVSVTQWEQNRTKPESDKLFQLARLFGTTVDWIVANQGPPPQRSNSTTNPEPPNAIVGEKIEFGNVQIPVFGKAVGGEDGEFEWNGDILYQVMAPPILSGVQGAYAVRVAGESMEPRYEDGEIAFVDPNRRVKRGDYVIAQIQYEDNGMPLAYIKRFVSHNSKELVVEQFNPAKELRFPHSSVVSVHYIALAGNA